MLDTTLTVTMTDPGLRLTLTVENAGPDSVEVTFPSGQRVEFLAIRDGETVWRWSEGRMFTQALSTARLDPGESVEFDGEWHDPPTGEFTVRGELAARSHDAAAEMTVSI